MVVCAKVTHPVRLLAEHGDQVALALVVGDDHREGNNPPRLVAPDFERGRPVGPHTLGKRQGAQSVCDTGRPSRPTFAILPSLKSTYQTAQHAITLLRPGGPPPSAPKRFSSVGRSRCRPCPTRSPSGLLVAAERHGVIELHLAVQSHGSGLELLGHPVRATEIAGPRGGREAIG